MAKIFVFILLTSFVTQSCITSAAPLNLGPVCQNMWNMAGNNLQVPAELKVVVGNNPLFKLELTGEAKINASIPFKTFEALVKNKANIVLQDAFLKAIVTNGGPVEQALVYLNTTGLLVPPQTLTDFNNTLRDMWFKPNPGKGFPHVFVGEPSLAFQTYTGFHNWYQFYLEQRKNSISNVNVASYSQNTEPKFIKLKFKWENFPKHPQGSSSSMFVGTSPAFDFALFSVCFLAQRGGGGGTDCTCRIGNSQLTIKVIPQTPTAVKTAYPTSVTVLQVG